MGPRIAYLVHDVTDAAVGRRIAMFEAAGATVRLAGFARAHAPDSVSGAAVTVLARTHDSDLKHRARSVLRGLARPAALRAVTRDADIIVARNLEMLVQAARVRRRDQRLIYECLDIHRLMLGDGAASRLLRLVERRLLARTDLVLTSSQAFVRQYFEARQHFAGPIRLVENKLLILTGAPPRPATAAAGPPWRIGWFGMLRCRKSLARLAAIAAAGRGAIEIVIAGRPSPAEFPDLAAQVGALPHVRYLGTYAPADLAALYGQVNFIWCVDYFEEGLNSAWLLPNRLYEGLAHGAVPLAERGTEIAAWIEREGVGRVFDDLAIEVAPWLATLGGAEYRRLRDAVDALPRARLVTDRAETAALLAAVAGTEGGKRE